MRVLVATNIAAIGIDIERLPYMGTLDFPHVAEDYGPRIVRTGRADDIGHANFFVAAEDSLLLKSLDGLTGESFGRELVPGFASTVLSAPPLT